MAVKNNAKNQEQSWFDWINSIEPLRGEDVVASTSQPPTEKKEIAVELPELIKQPELPAKKVVDISALSFETLIETVSSCTLCPLSETRITTVPGEGDKNAQLMFIGEGPGADEDKSGKPFVGRAGQLLTKIIEGGLGISRSECYIANIVKCRPPHNRNPFDSEVTACIPYLHRQIELIKPKMIVLLGRVAMNHLLAISPPLKIARAQKHTYKHIPVVVTYHPAALLRNPALKKDLWSDLQVVIKELELPGA